MEKEEIEKCRHSLAHILAKALKQTYPSVKFAFGPAIDNGCYYDVDLEENISEEDYKKIEKAMTAIINRAEPFTKKVLSKKEALELFKDEPFKVEHINELPENEEISAYFTGEDFVDLCRGPHIEKTSKLANWGFKIAKVNGAYWKGDAKNKMLKRIYVYAFPTKKELFDYEKMLEEAAKRDHRKLGKDLDIFMFSDLVGRGLPMWLPNGFIVRRTLNDYIMNKELALGYKHVMTPSIGSVDLYKTSGHWDHYKDDMFPAMKVDEESYVLRPMNCPHHMMMFKNSMHSYKDLPLRIAEIANDFRYESSGTLCGIERTRAFTQNDSHIFCRPEQIRSEVEGVIKLILDVYKDFGFTNYNFRLSLRDKNNTEKYFGNDELWEKSEKALREIIKSCGAEYYEAEGEAAFYGPKIDVQVKSALGHEVTLSTVQLDYQLPERFELEYVDENNTKVRPVVIHRAILGSLDRFVAFLIEETAGAFPVWLAPVQAKVLNISEATEDYATEINNKLVACGIRSELDVRNEKIGYKIREAASKKVPYIVVLGDKEKEEKTVTIRKRGSQDSVNMSLEDFCAEVMNNISKKSLSL